MTMHPIPLPTIAEKLAVLAVSAAASRDKATDPAQRQRLATMAADFESMAQSIRMATSEVPAPAIARKAKPPASSKMTASEFWAAHSQAVQAISDAYGRRWRFDAPFGDAVLVSVPTRLRHMVGERGGKITWSRDWTMPAPKYWPGQTMPADLVVAPDYARADSACSEVFAARRLHAEAHERFRTARGDMTNYFTKRTGSLSWFRGVARGAISDMRRARLILTQIGQPLEAPERSAAWWQSHGCVFVPELDRWEDEMLVRVRSIQMEQIAADKAFFEAKRLARGVVHHNGGLNHDRHPNRTAVCRLLEGGCRSDIIPRPDADALPAIR